jgi:hypothetical protein
MAVEFLGKQTLDDGDLDVVLNLLEEIGAMANSGIDWTVELSERQLLAIRMFKDWGEDGWRE